MVSPDMQEFRRRQRVSFHTNTLPFAVSSLVTLTRYDDCSTASQDQACNTAHWLVLAVQANRVRRESTVENLQRQLSEIQDDYNDLEHRIQRMELRMQGRRSEESPTPSDSSLQVSIPPLPKKSLGLHSWMLRTVPAHRCLTFPCSAGVKASLIRGWRICLVWILHKIYPNSNAQRA